MRALLLLLLASSKRDGNLRDISGLRADGGRRQGDGRRRPGGGLEGLDLLSVLVPVRAQDDRPELTVPGQPLESLPVLPVQVLTELAEQVPEERRVRHDCDALLRPGVEPLEELYGPLAAVLVALALVGVEDVLVVQHLGEVEVGELGRDFADAAPAVADVVPPPLPAVLLDQEAGGGDLEARPVLGGVGRRLSGVEKGRDSRLPRPAEHVERRLARPGQRRHDDQVERGEAPRSGWALGEVRLEVERLLDPLLGESGVVQGMVLRGRQVAPEEAVVRPAFFRGDVVVPLGVADEVDLLGPLGQEDREPRLRRAERELEAVALHGRRAKAGRAGALPQEAGRHGAKARMGVVVAAAGVSDL